MSARAVLTGLLVLVSLGTSTPTSLVAVERVKRQSSDGWCKLPPQPVNGLYLYQATPDLRIDSTGIYVPSGWVLSYSCDTSFGLNSSQSDSTCDSGVWDNPLDCHKLCPPLVAANMDISCEFGGWSVPCDKAMWPKTKATTSCKPTFSPSVSRLPKLVCQTNGKWDYPLFQCTGSCGISLDPEVHETLITGGNLSRQGEFPWLTALYYRGKNNEWEQRCGGTLITTRIVLTAGHCLILTDGKITPEKLKIGLGKFKRDYYSKESGSVIVDVKKIVTPRNYDSSGFALDIGMLSLKESVKITHYVLPACFDWSGSTVLQTGDVGSVGGWGATDNSTNSDVILSGKLVYIANPLCKQNIIPTYKVFVTHDKFCAGSDDKAQVAKGDSGGGLTFTKAGKHYLLGVVSARIKQVKTFSLFTDLTNAEHLAWMRQTKKILEDDFR